MNFAILTVTEVNRINFDLNYDTNNLAWHIRMRRLIKYEKPLFISLSKQSFEGQTDTHERRA